MCNIVNCMTFFFSLKENCFCKNIVIFFWIYKMMLGKIIIY